MTRFGRFCGQTLFMFLGRRAHVIEVDAWLVCKSEIALSGLILL